MIQKPVLLIGGYGVSGRGISTLLRRRNPDLPLVIAGRSLEKAQALADELGGAQALAIDLDRPNFDAIDPNIGVLALIAYDPSQRALAFASRAAAPYLCLSGAAFELCVDLVPGMLAARRMPMVTASNWFGGAVTLAALDVAQRFSRVDEIEIGIVIDRGGEAGGAGPATIADFERITSSCPSTLLRRGGQYQWVSAEASRAAFKRSDGVNVDGAGAVSYDVLSLGTATEADDIRVLEAWGLSASRAAGGPPSDEINIRMRGQGPNGAPLKVDQTIACPRDAAPLTVVTTTLLIERLAGLPGTGGVPAPGLYSSEHLLTPQAFMKELIAAGAAISER